MGAATRTRDPSTIYDEESNKQPKSDHEIGSQATSIHMQEKYETPANLEETTPQVTQFKTNLLKAQTQEEENPYFNYGNLNEEDESTNIQIN